LASIGLTTLFVSFMCTRLRKRLPRIVASGMGVIVISTFGLLVWYQGGAYQSVETIWQDTLSKKPDFWMANNNLGLALADQGELDKAVAHYLAAIRLKPDHYKAHNNLGQCVCTPRKTR
jgi:tetratricopeptide (TPR) repeat protein